MTIILILGFACMVWIYYRADQAERIRNGNTLHYIVKEAGEKSYHNKTYIDERGYRRYKDSKRLVHRVVAEKKLGRRLYAQEVVHHIDRNKLNNHPENLYVFANQEAHDRVHKIDAERFGYDASYRGFRYNT